MREGPSGRDCSGWARRADCPPAFMRSPGRLRPAAWIRSSFDSINSPPNGRKRRFQGVESASVFDAPRFLSSPRPAPHIPESQVDCGGHSEICGPRFPAANCPFPQEKRWTERQGTRTQANSHARWPARFKHETVCRCRALSLPGRLPLARSAKALWRLSRDSPSAHHPEAAGQCSSCSVCSRRSTSGRAMAE